MADNNCPDGISCVDYTEVRQVQCLKTCAFPILLIFQGPLNDYHEDRFASKTIYSNLVRQRRLVVEARTLPLRGIWEAS